MGEINGKKRNRGGEGRMRGYREEEVDWESRELEMKELDTTVSPVPGVALILK